MCEIGFRLLLRIGDLLFGESVDRQGTVHDVRTVPNAALFVKAIFRMSEVQGSHADDGMFGGVCPRCLDVYD